MNLNEILSTAKTLGSDNLSDDELKVLLQVTKEIIKEQDEREALQAKLNKAIIDEEDAIAESVLKATIKSQPISA